MADSDAAPNPEALLGEAVLLRARGRRREAIEKCQQVLRLAPKNAEAFEVLGDLYREGGLAQAALEAYHRAFELNPSRGNLELKIARAALRKASFDRQLQTTRDLIEGKATPEKKRSPTTAGLLSLLIPGLGQAYNHDWVKAAGLLCLFVFLSMADVAAALRIMLAGRPPGLVGLDPVAFVSAFFSSPALWWTLLQVALYLYSVIDAALTAGRSPSEDTGLI